MKFLFMRQHWLQRNVVDSLAIGANIMVMNINYFYGRGGGSDCRSSRHRKNVRKYRNTCGVRFLIASYKSFQNIIK